MVVISVLAATAAASAILGNGMDDGTPHGRVLAALQRVAEAQETHHRQTGRFAPWRDQLDVTMPAGIRATVIRADGSRWEAMAVDPEVGLTCSQSGSWAAEGPIRGRPECFTRGR